MANTEMTGSIEEQCSKRLDTLYRKSHTWLLQVGYNICKNGAEAQELVSDLYVYLAKKCRPQIWYDDSYNLIYCMKFMNHRWLNRVGKLKRFQYIGGHADFDDSKYSEYDYDRDEQVMKAYDDVMKELNALRITKMWPQAKIYEIYWMGDDTLNEVARKIGISKSTTFLAIKKIRKHLKDVVKTPFE